MIPISDGSPANPDKSQVASDQRDQDGLRYTREELEEIGDMLSDLDRTRLSPRWNISGEDWHAIFNPNVMRRLDVNLVHDLDHNSVVCCVRFSRDGNYLATGCDRSAQIFDVVTGEQVCHLAHGSRQYGYFYVRAVCFSPDSKTLVTGAEDNIVRVRSERPSSNGNHLTIYTGLGCDH